MILFSFQFCFSPEKKNVQLKSVWMQRRESTGGNIQKTWGSTNWHRSFTFAVCHRRINVWLSWAVQPSWDRNPGSLAVWRGVSLDRASPKERLQSLIVVASESTITILVIVTLRSSSQVLHLCDAILKPGIDYRNRIPDWQCGGALIFSCGHSRYCGKKKIPHAQKAFFPWSTTQK